MNESCERFRANPAGDPEHFEQCESCQRALDALDRELAEAARIPTRPVAIALPLAPWEGASDRPWPLVAAFSLGVLALAAMLFMASGVSPLAGFLSAIQGSVFPRVGLLDAGVIFSKVLEQAPARVHAAVGVAFIAANFVLYRLLRRPARGYDATR